LEQIKKSVEKDDLKAIAAKFESARIKRMRFLNPIKIYT